LLVEGLFIQLRQKASKIAFGSFIHEIKINASVRPRHQDAIHVLQMASEVRIASLYLAIVRILRDGFPLVLIPIANEIISENHPDIIKFESLGGVHGPYLFHSRIIRRPFPERVLFFLGHFKITDLYIIH